jgi:CRISPR system Cascade subunit CasD
MQSWGYRSRSDYRDTALEPTRSGVIGLICAAMGIARGEDISRFDAIRMGVRVDREGRPERDYHTAGGDHRKPREYGVIKTDGSGIDSVVSYRDYLADASFTVGLQSGDKDLLETITHKLGDPEWTLFLGRKAFPLAMPPVRTPGSPILEGDLEKHLLKPPPPHPFREPERNVTQWRVVLEAPDGERTQHDWPLCFGERRFKPRSTTTRLVEGGEAG